MNTSKRMSFGQILKSTSLLGSASLINVLLGVIRVKVLAVQLGPALFGVMSLYSNFVSTIGSVASLGIGQSAVRDIAEASSLGNEQVVAKKITVLRRVVWVTGIAGFVATLVLAIPGSNWVFGNYDHAWAIAMLAVIVPLTQLQSGQSALLSGLRHIGDLARINVIGGILSTVLAIALLLLFRENGVVSFLIAVVVGQLVVSWWYARKINVQRIAVSWRECLDESREMVQLGLAMVVSGAALTVSTMVILVILRNHDGESAVGLYQSALTISSIYIGFILQGMIGDYFPRLVGVAGDRLLRNQVVCEQSELAMLLAVPGLVAVLVLSGFLITLLYSTRFNGASEILGWLVLGMLGRIISWPQGFVLLACSDKSALVATELFTATFHVTMVWIGVQYFGAVGAGMAFAAQYCLHVLLISWIVKARHGFVLSTNTLKVILSGLSFVLISFGTTFIPELYTRYICGALVLLMAMAWSLHGLTQRIGRTQVVAAIQKVAGKLRLNFLQRALSRLAGKV